MITEKSDKDNMPMPFRALDITTDQGFFCGRILADLGFDVIKVEPPEGDPGRNIGPFYQGKISPETSLFWFAYNANKRGITLDIENKDGQEIFRMLAKRVDVVIESFPRGYMDGLGLGYSSLKEIDNKIIMASITPFGSTGPYKDYKSSELISTAMSGFMNLCGDQDRPPVIISFPHVSLHGSAQAAVAILAACYSCETTGKGQHIDVAIRESVIQMLGPPISTYLINDVEVRRAGQHRVGWGPGLVRQIWPCKDGYVIFLLGGGSVRARPNIALTEWMIEEGLANDFIKAFNWDEFDMATTTEEEIKGIEEAFCGFFMHHGKTELFEEGARRRIDIYPVNDCKEIAEEIQLKERDFWVEAEHPELGEKITYPGPFVKSSEIDTGVRHRAPLIGEHNEDIYVNELGFSRSEFSTLKEARII
ncbi:CaiB/BaiF CoA transferase family protein [Thermodesulfobacteriota bacterium]